MENSLFLGFVVVKIGTIIRYKVSETPIFKRVVKRKNIARIRFMELVKEY